MRRLAVSLAALAALASPVPLHAQAPVAPDAEDTLRCAMWASYFTAAFEGEEEETVFLAALNYFVGRYEGLTGAGIDRALDRKVIVEAAEAIDALTPVCMARIAEFGDRMVAWGQALDAVGAQLPDEGEPTS